MNPAERARRRGLAVQARVLEQGRPRRRKAAELPHRGRTAQGRRAGHRAVGGRQAGATPRSPPHPDRAAGRLRNRRECASPSSAAAVRATRWSSRRTAPGCCSTADSARARRCAASRRLGLAPEQLSAILVTHEHDDHIGGVARLARKFELPVWVTPGTLRGLDGAVRRRRRCIGIEGYARLCIGDIEVQPFPVPHDAREPAQYVFGDGATRLGVLDRCRMRRPLTSGACSTGATRWCWSPITTRSCWPRSDYPPRAQAAHRRPLRAPGQRAGGRTGRRARLHAAAAHGGRAPEPEQQSARLGARALAAALGCTPDWIAVADQDARAGLAPDRLRRAMLRRDLGRIRSRCWRTEKSRPAGRLPVVFERDVTASSLPEWRRAERRGAKRPRERAPARERARAVGREARPLPSCRRRRA